MLVLTAAPLEAQIGRLVRRAAQQVVPSVPAGEQDVYTEHLLELTDEVLPKVIVGKQAGKQFSASPAGPSTLRTRHAAAQEAADNFRQRNLGLLDSWDERQQLQRQCADSAYAEVSQRRSDELGERMMSDPVLRQKMIELSPRLAAAQQKGDTAELARISAELGTLGKPTASDSNAVRRACPADAAPPAVAQHAAMVVEAGKLQAELTRAEARVEELEERASGLTRRQLSLACERILIYLSRLEKQGAQKGFSATELEALDRHKRDLEKLCS
jgi:hypothetical protein